MSTVIWTYPLFLSGTYERTEWLKTDYQVVSVDLQGTQLDHTFVPALTRSPLIYQLYLHDRQLGPELSRLNSNKNLVWLHILQAGPQSQIGHVRGWNQLGLLDLTECHAPVGGLELLRELPKLTNIWLHESDHEIARQLAGWTQLKHIWIRHEGSLAPLIPALQAIPNLDSIELTGKISLDDWNELMGLSNLRYLRVSKLSREVYLSGVWRAICQWPHLTECQLEYSGDVSNDEDRRINERHRIEAQEHCPKVEWMINFQ